MIDSVFGTGKNYYPQAFLEECKYVVKEKMLKYITDNIEIASDEENSDKKILMKKIIAKTKCLFRKNNFKNGFFERAVFKM